MKTFSIQLASMLFMIRKISCFVSVGRQYASTFSCRLQPSRLLLSSSISSVPVGGGSSVQPKKKKSKKAVKRREFVGLAKAVDRGQFTVYQPLGKDGTFTAKSGLPNRKVPFTVLGIESSCDDTGGEFSPR